MGAYGKPRVSGIWRQPSRQVDPCDRLAAFFIHKKFISCSKNITWKNAMRKKESIPIAGAA
jgi:hypothetical protein